jgi:hypothetical protein
MVTWFRSVGLLTLAFFRNYNLCFKHLIIYLGHVNAVTEPILFYNVRLKCVEK